MKAELFAVLGVKNYTDTKTETSSHLTKTIASKMNEIPFENPGDMEFPEDTILKEVDHGRNSARFYVFDGRTLVDVRKYPSSKNRTAHYRLLNELRDEYSGFDVKSGTWNPVRYRTKGDNYKSVKTPAKLVEEK